MHLVRDAVVCFVSDPLVNLRFLYNIDFKNPQSKWIFGNVVHARETFSPDAQFF